ncbi:MAG: NUDIX hydrolase [Proteobacteria bacterium]|nr:NUDIX hydrolase [Pseudomonadota bacterium]
MADLPDVWPEIAREPLADCRVFSVSRSLARSPRTGGEHAFFRIDADDWVNLVPVTPEGQVVMVRQYRHGSRDVTLEIPGGIVDPGESPAEAAARELLEETGYRAERVVRTGSVNPNPALFGNRVHSFAAFDVRWEREIRNESTEHTAVELLPLSDVDEALRAGRISSALVVAAFHWLRLHREGAP